MDVLACALIPVIQLVADLVLVLVKYHVLEPVVEDVVQVAIQAAKALVSWAVRIDVLLAALVIVDKR